MKELYVAKKSPVLSISSSAKDAWESFCCGDRDALGKIFHSHIDDLYHYGMHFCRDSEMVKDAIQDLFQNLWLEHEHLSHDVRNIRYYLLSSLRRRLLRSLQKDRRNHFNAPSGSFDFELIPPQEDVIIGNETHQQQLAQLHSAISGLTLRQREAIYLRFYQSLSYAEIAQLMSMKVDSVYNLISKAIGLLKNMFLLFILINII